MPQSAPFSYWIIFGPIAAVGTFSLLLLGLGRTGQRPPDAAWKGLFYSDANDPALLVPKRFGIGYTLNFGNPWSWAVLAFVLVMVAGHLFCWRQRRIIYLLRDNFVNLILGLGFTSLTLDSSGDAVQLLHVLLRFCAIHARATNSHERPTTFFHGTKLFMGQNLPSLVIVGRPNVGKSTLFNRLTGTRRAIVTDEPGITRDRIYGKADWRGRALEIVDTGGLVPDDKALIPQEILRQARVAIDNAALLVLVVDTHAGITPLDQELARLLRTTGKPFVIAANKVDARSQEANVGSFHSMGVPVFPIAAEHGTGIDDLLDAALAQVEVVDSVEEEKRPDVIEVAIIGRPNVGKSTLLNRLAGEERSIVSPIPGTTMDNVDTEVVREHHTYRFVDTAGIRRKGKTTLVAEKLSVVMARRGLERCDVALLIVDGEQGVTQGDAQIANYAEQSNRSVVIAINKWDLAVKAARNAEARDAESAKGKSRRSPGEQHRPEDFEIGRLLFEYEKMIRGKLKFLSYAPIVFLSASTGERVEKLWPLINQCWNARRRKISTPELNRWLKEEVDLQRGTTPKARPVRIYYMTQAKIAPPTFLMFTNQKNPLHFSYERFLENQIRGKFDFVGTPIRFIQRLRTRRDKNSDTDN